MSGGNDFIGLSNALALHMFCDIVSVVIQCGTVSTAKLRAELSLFSVL